MAEILFKDEYEPVAQKEQATQPTGKVIDLDTGEYATQETIDPSTVEPTPFPEEQNFLTDMFGDDSRASTDLPELGAGGLLSDEDNANILKITPALLTTIDNKETAEIIANNFPNIGLQYSPSGEIILGNNETGAKVVVNKPGFSKRDLIQALGIASAFTPAGKAAFYGTRGMVAAAPHVLAQRATQGMLGAAGTQAAIEKMQEVVGGEFDEDEIRIAGSLGFAAELAIPAIQAFRQSRNAKSVGATVEDLPKVRMDVSSAKQSTDAVKDATGVDVGLFQAQQSQIPSELLKQRLLPQLDAGSRQAAHQLEKQNKEVFEATSELINLIADPKVVATGSKRFKTASEKAISAAKERRSAEASGFFNEAIELGADVDVNPVQDTIKALLTDSVPGQQQAVLRKVLKSLTKGKKPATLKQLDNAKDEINRTIEKATGSDAVTNKTKRILVNIKNQLVEQMESASEPYRNGMNKYREFSPAVKDLEDSILGQISKLDDINLKTISRKIFDPANELTNPTVIKNAKKVIDKVDPGAWDDLMRVEMNRRVGGIQELTEDVSGELVGNIPGQLRRAIFGNPSQRKALLSGMSTEQRSNFKYLDDVLRRASSGRNAGSPTTPFKEIADKLRGVSLVVRDFIFKPLDSLQKTGERTMFDKNVNALTNIMFDTSYTKQFKKLKQLDPSSPAAAKAMAQLLKSAQETK